eukprot:TRINITY_DN30870_c0_g1_i1.p1 TRINITY_DN30870_c0_g1~~TRINITY_DN30870_c0_g1_i1.p1  ORF type:complete len:470 (-),score=47.22 TRINITY_DN30870_c0_g1_i1:85-1494(-)
MTTRRSRSREKSRAEDDVVSSDASMRPSDLGNEKEHAAHNPLHRDRASFQVRPSLLSSENSSDTFRGFLNLMIILLVVTNFRLVVVNLMKYGIIFDFSILAIKEWHRWPSAVAGLCLVPFILLSLFIERYAARKGVREPTVLQLKSLNLAGLVFVPSIIIWTWKPNPATALIVMLCCVTFFMKMYSYHAINRQHRLHVRPAAVVNESKEATPAAVAWPNNLTLSDLGYFVMVPTLIYQLEYPRTPRVRRGWLARRLAEALFFSVLILCIVEQYIRPLINNSRAPMESNDLPRIVERILKLSIPNLYVWLLGFYVFFHLYMNVLAEICCFGDRLFYKDWWNATTLKHFWSNWNMLVHNWMMCHIFRPMMDSGYSRQTGFFVCFVLSAVFHELIIAVPFQMLKFWAFFGMMGQLPLIVLTEKLKGKQIGNVIFWISIVLGQPFLVFMTMLNWYQQHPEMAGTGMSVNPTFD